MSEHTIRRYEDELQILKEKILAMCGRVEKATKRSVKSLVRQDVGRAQKVIDRDENINSMELEIDEMTRTILALRQPAASDLRFVMTTIKIVTDLERMGDLAEDIAENMLKTAENPVIQIASRESLSERVVKQIKLSLDSFANADVDSAIQCVSDDARISDINRSIQREYLTYMIEDPHQITAALIASNIANNLERISDHAVNISEMVVYMVTGRDIRHIDPEKAAAMVGATLNSD